MVKPLDENGLVVSAEEAKHLWRQAVEPFMVETGLEMFTIPLHVLEDFESDIELEAERDDSW